MKYNHQSKILISGPAAAGTTLLLATLAGTGMETGFYPNETRDTIKGLEYVDSLETVGTFEHHRNSGLDISPRVIKRPIHGAPGNKQETILDMADGYGWQVDYVVLCLREWENRVKSAKQYSLNRTNGYIHNEDLFVDQQRRTLYQFHKLIYQLTARDIPFTTIEFPRFARDFEYCANRLLPLLNLEGYSTLELSAGLKAVVQEKRIHVG